MNKIIACIAMLMAAITYAQNQENLKIQGTEASAINLTITEIFPGQSGADLTADWFEIQNTGVDAWVSGVDADLYYDDESADPTTADLIQGITEIASNASVIVLVTNDVNDITTFMNVWAPVIDLTGVQIGYTDGAGLGGGGDAANIWLGDPNLSAPIATGSYPDTAANDGQSYDVDLSAFSVVGNTNNAVATLVLGGTNADTPNIGSPGNGLAATPTLELTITEVFPGQAGTDLSADWFEITNTGTAAWISGVDEDLYYDDESASSADADLIQGLTEIQPGESVIVLITGDTNDITVFTDVWNPVIDLSNVEVGYTDGSGLGGGGDAATLWLGDPTLSVPVASAAYPDTTNNDGQSYDSDLDAFSVVGNANGAVETIALGGANADVPNIGSPGNGLAAPPALGLTITEIFPGQEGDDLTVDWFEIRNNGLDAWVSGVDANLYYDDESASGADADLIMGISEIQPNERVIVLLTDDVNDIDVFNDVWSPVLDLTNTQIGYTDGSGLGGGGDAVTLWLGDPLLTTPIDTATYPDTAANDGQSYDSALGAFSDVGNANGAVETLALGGDNSDVPNIGSPGDALPNVPFTVQFEIAFTSVSESDNSIEIAIVPNEAPDQIAAVEVALIPGGTAQEGTHFNYASMATVFFPIGQTGPQTLTIPITNNSTDASDLFFVLQLQNGNNAEIGGLDVFSVYILDDDTEVPEGDATEIDLTYLTSYEVDASGTAEITAFDADSQRLFVANGDKIEVLDFSDPTNITSIATVNVSDFGADSVQSIATSNGIVAAAMSLDPATDPGIVVISDANGDNPVALQVGVLPDMLTFSPDGNLLLVANEGQPSGDYTIDPEGSVTVIDVSGGLGNITQANVTALDFNDFDSQQAALEAAGVRIYGPGASVSEDLEPEYIAVSSDSEKAYVSLQENNAYAIVDLVNLEITEIISYGLKDHSLPSNTLDLSDEPGFIFDANWPVKGMYMPDAIAFYEVDGTQYIVTANEGDARDYNAYSEERKLDDSDYILDPTVFSDIDILEMENNLGDINVTIASGDIDNDGDFDEIHVYGGRSFSIFNAETGALVYDSGNDFEVITAADPVYGAIFNASNSNNSFKNRSDNKGPEPEGVTIAEIQGESYAFILLERIGGVMAYNISDPANPVFLEYENSRDATPGGSEMGDLGPEGIVYIAPENNATERGVLVISNEVSATLSIYTIENDIILGVDDFEISEDTFIVVPNPASDRVFFSKPGTYSLYDVTGRFIKKVVDASSLDISEISSGTFFLTNTYGTTRKLFIK